MSIQSNPPQHVTPSDSFASQPLTSPPTDERPNSVSLIIKEVKDRQQGCNLTDTPWTDYTLGPEAYDDVLPRLQNDKNLWRFVENKLRHGYFPSANRLVLGTPALVHDQFILHLVEEIQVQLESIEGIAAAFAKEINPGGSSSIKFSDQGYGKHDPDAQFEHSKAQYPGVVIEVSYSQKTKDLARLADDYILGSDGKICAVVGLDIEYESSKEATLSIWRPHIETNEAGEKELSAQQTVKKQVFRDSNGKPNISRAGGLHLRLRDFATEALAKPEGQLRDPIVISASNLCSLLQRAEDRATFIKQQKGIKSTDTFVRKRHRDSTPPEELTRKDEKKFRANEKRAEDEATNDDTPRQTGTVSEAESN